MFGVKGNIEGVIVKQLNKIPDENGTIFHMIKSSDEEFKGFGEIYFSTIYPGIVKGWHLHKIQIQNYAVIKGMIKLVLMDHRKGSKTASNQMEIVMGEDNYILVQIPPGVWNGFSCVGNKKAIVANCATIEHDPHEMERASIEEMECYYRW